MKSAVIYARVSSKDQEREGYSIPAQLKFLREYAQKNDFHIEQEFVDVETAKMAGRKRFGEMVRYFEKTPDCRVVIVEKTDRLYRNLRDCLTLEDLDVEIHLPKEGPDHQQGRQSQSKLIHGIPRRDGPKLHRKPTGGSEERNARKGRAGHLSQSSSRRIPEQQG